MSRRRPFALAGLAVLVVGLLPFAPGLLSGGSFFFRDLGNQYFPIRAFVIEGLRHGELRYWDPYVHEGEAVSPPVGYPVDLLQLPLGDPPGLSLVLALHVPLAALGALLLGRALGLSPLAAAGTALVYALGGFMLSSLNLFVHLQAGAWAPFLVLALFRAAAGGSRSWVLAALPVAVTLSCLGVEVGAQAVLVGLVLGFSRAGLVRRLAGLAVTMALAVGLAAPVLLVFGEMTGQGARAGGLPPEMALAFSVHPVALLQIVVAGLFGDVPTSLRHFWGHRFFSGFPYFLSLYLGAATLAVALLGGIHQRANGQTRRVVALALLGLLVCLGPTVGLGALLDRVPLMAALRFPSKAFFLPHLGVALLFGWGIDALADRERRGFGRLAWLGGALGGALVAAALLVHLVPLFYGPLAQRFFPEAYSAARRHAALLSVSRDAAVGGSLALLVGLIALAARRGLLSARLARPAVVMLAVADLLRAGAPLNPMVDASFWSRSPEVQRLAERVRMEGGRLFTCDPARSLSLFRMMSRPGRDDELVLLRAVRESLVPYHNVGLRVPTALSQDTSGFLPEARALEGPELSCRNLLQLLPRLRRAGVSHVVTLDPLVAPGLEIEAAWTPARLEGLQMRLLRVSDRLPLREVARHAVPVASAAEAAVLVADPRFQANGGAAVEGLESGSDAAEGHVRSVEEGSDRLELEVEADRPTVVVVRDAFAPGWRASVNGVPAGVLRADGRHRAVAVPAGKSRVVLTYHPPGLRLGCLLAVVSLLAALGLYYRPIAHRRPRQPEGAG